MKKYLIIILFLVTCKAAQSQAVPAVDENIPYLITFGGNSLTSWGDDDFCQIFFVVIPSTHTSPFYIRVFDPDTGGALDEVKESFNTVVEYSVYGGPGCWSDTAAQSIHPRGNHRTGYLMASRSFGADSQYDSKWYTFGPFNPSEGENVEKVGGRVFKIIAQGKAGDDGNIYRYYLSTSPVENIPVEGGNCFTYKYHFRLSDNQKDICQVYPFADDQTISIEVRNFDWDNDGIIRIFSVAKNGKDCDVSGEDNWVVENFEITEEEKNTTIEIQFIKNRELLVKNNNVVVTVRNQYGTSLAFYVIPIGGIPVYSPKIRMR